jgi:hypothetical protein
LLFVVEMLYWGVFTFFTETQMQDMIDLSACPRFVITEIQDDDETTAPVKPPNAPPVDDDCGT